MFFDVERHYLKISKMKTQNKVQPTNQPKSIGPYTNHTCSRDYFIVIHDKKKVARID